MIQVHKQTIKYMQWKDVKRIMTAAKHRRHGFCHVELDVQEVVVTESFRLNAFQEISAGHYFNVTIEYTVK